MTGATPPGRPRPAWRAVDGLLLLDKPLALSSNQALQRARRIYRAAKAGHTGSLDPLASGMLPICFGQGTKVCAYLLDADKAYTARIALGARTASGDAEGEPVEEAPVPAPDADRLAAAARGLTGPIQQVPPMYSALKVDGQRLYALARAGVTVEREARAVTIHALDAVYGDAEGRTVEIRVRCSKGTYVRTLAEDLARALGTLGHLTMLRREWAAPFEGQGMVTLDALEALAGDEGALDALLLPLDAALPDWPALALGPAEADAIRYGRAVPSGLAAATVRRELRLNVGGRLIALGAIEAGGTDVAPFRLFEAGAGT